VLCVQDILVVAIGKFVLRIDVGKVQQKPPPGGFNGQRPIVCEVERPLEGVEVVGAHEEQVTDLAVPSFVSSHVASASQDGTVSQALSIFSLPFLALFCPCQCQEGINI